MFHYLVIIPHRVLTSPDGFRMTVDSDAPSEMNGITRMTLNQLASECRLLCICLLALNLPTYGISPSSTSLVRRPDDSDR